MKNPFDDRGSVTRDSIRLPMIEIGYGLKGWKNAVVIEHSKGEFYCEL